MPLFECPPRSAKPGRDLALEGLRGLCALLVIYDHITYSYPMLDPVYSAYSIHLGYGPPAVLMFFVISGYAIGLSVQGDATRRSVLDYAWRRVVRIVPIAWAAVLISWLLMPAPARTILGNLLFLQNYEPYPFGVGFPVLRNDPPLWSLSFEVLYYLLFVLVWKLKPRAGVLVGATLLVGFAYLPPVGLPIILSKFAWGYLFWLGGLSIAWFTKPLEPAPGEVRSPWLFAIAGAFALWTLAPIRAYVVLACPHLFGENISPTYNQPDFILAAAAVILAVTGRAPILQTRLSLACAAVGLSILPFKAYSGNLQSTDVAAALILALWPLARRWRLPVRPLRLLAPVGQVSYALYVVAFPIMVAILHNRILPLPSGSLGSYILRLLTYAVACGVLAWFLERVFQPWLARRARRLTF
jgi:peptidoglycan/LPS O-acetylase OafA/YrhL